MNFKIDRLTGFNISCAGGFGASVNLNFRPLEFEGDDVNLPGLEVGLGAFYSF